MMDKKEFSKTLRLEDVRVTDAFWHEEMELVRTEVIPYQWRALNDQVPGAAKSFCMRNYRIAGEKNRERQLGTASEMVYTTNGFETLPKDEEEEKEPKFFGFVFQDSDFSKWVEAVAYSLAQHPDPELEKTADEAIDIVCAAQREDGYLDTFYLLNDESKIFTNLRDHHELYCFGHLAEGAAAYYEATGKDKLLKAAERYAHFISTKLGKEEGKKPGYPGHEIAEMALMRLHALTGKQEYLELARYFVDERGKRPYYFDVERNESTPEDKLNYEYHQAHLPVREQGEAVGHAVRAVYLYSGMADVAKATGDESLYAACEKLWESIVDRKMYVTGGIGATHVGEAFSFDYDLPNDTAYAETCASIGLVFFARRMLEIHADAKYADVMELALYNGILSGMALDGKSFFYVNPLEVLPEACRRDERKAHVKPLRQKWFGCACCPPNLARTIASISKYAFTEKEDTLWVHLYIGAEVNTGAVKLSIQSEFPWDGHVSLTVDEAPEEEYTVALRIPGWCGKYEASEISGAKSEVKNGYLYLTKQWKKGDVISLNFPMEPVALLANPAVREDAGKAAVKRGPVVYCLEEADNGADLPALKLALPLKAELRHVAEMGREFVRIDAEGVREERCESHALYAEYRPAKEEKKALSYIPYFLWNNRGEGEMQVWTRFFEA